MKRLLIRPGAIGDFIVSLPAMEALRGDYTEVWCAEQNVPLAGFADCALSMGTAGIERLGFLPADDVLERLRAFDSIVSWYGTARAEFREITSALPIHFFPALPDGACHAVDFYNAQARQLGVQPVRLPVIRCAEKARTFAAIHPFASGVAKRAPMSLFEGMAVQLSDRMPVHWLAGPEEELENAVRFPDLLELACWLKGAKIFVGNDSGISHLAAAVRTPTLVCFRSTDPTVWAPRGPAVHVITESDPTRHAVPAASELRRSSTGS